MEYLNQFANVFSGLSGITFLIGIIILYKVGLLQFLLDLKKNGKNGNGKELQELKNQVEMLGENHLHEIAQKLDIIKTNSQIEIELLRDIKTKVYELD